MSQYVGYNSVSQAVTELLAEGAPTRPFMVTVAGFPCNGLVLALGLDVWMSAGRRLASRITGGVLILYAVISYLGGTVFQMDPRETEGSVRTMLRERATAVMVFSMLLAMGFGAFARGMRFRIYSLGTLVTVLLFAGLTFVQVAKACRQRAGAVARAHRARQYLRLDALGGGAGSCHVTGAGNHRN